MRRVLILAVMTLFTLMLGVSQAQKVDLCDSPNYSDNQDLFGTPLDGFKAGNLKFSKEEDGISYYNLTCTKGHTHETPAGQEPLQENKITWAFVDKNGEKVAYARLMSFKVHQFQPILDQMTKDIGSQPKITDGKKVKVYTWHTKKGVSIKLKAYKVVNDKKHLHPKNVADCDLFKIGYYFDNLRPEEGVVQKKGRQ